MRYAYAGDREISCNVLRFLIEKDCKPLVLFISDDSVATHDEKLVELSGLDDDFIFRGNEFKSPDAIDKLKSLNLDYIIGIHFPYIISSEILNIPKVGFLNLHPAFLPYNKGWNTPSWAILDKTPFGATLHFMSEQLDKGDIIHQKQMEVDITDTADSLYKKILKLEEEVFFEAFDSLVKLQPNRVQQKSEGSAHNKKDLKKIQEINLEEVILTKDLIDKIRGLTTNEVTEAAFFVENNRKVALQIKLIEID